MGNSGTSGISGIFGIWINWVAIVTCTVAAWIAAFRGNLSSFILCSSMAALNLFLVMISKEPRS